MKNLKQIFPKNKPHRILFCIICGLNIIILLLYALAEKLSAYDGFWSYHSGISSPGMCCFCMVLFILAFLPVIDFEKINIYSVFIFVLFLVCHLTLLYKSRNVVYPHFKNSVIYRDARFQIKNITLNDFNNISRQVTKIVLNPLENQGFFQNLT